MDAFENPKKKFDKSLSGLGDWKRSVFDLIIKQYLLERLVPDAYFSFCQYAHSFVVGLSAAQLSVTRIFLQRDISLEEAHNSLWFVFGITVVVLGMNLLLVVLHKLQFRIRALLEVCIYLNLTYTYIVYPIMIFTGATWVFFEKQISTTPFTSTIFFVNTMLGVPLNCLLLALRNDVPTKSPTSSPNQALEVYLSVFNAIIQVASVYSDKHSYAQSSIRYVLQSIIFIAQVIAVLWVLLNQVFWKDASQQAMVVSRGKLLAFYGVCFFFGGRPFIQQTIVFLVVQSLLSKILVSLIHSSRKAQVFSRASLNSTYFCAMLRLEQFALDSKSERSGGQSHENQDLSFYYNGLWTEFLNKRPLETRTFFDNSHSLKMPRSNFVRNLEELSSQLKSARLIKFLIFMKAANPFAYLKTIQRDIFLLFEYNNRLLFSTFDIYHYKLLFESKLEALYKSTSKDDKELGFEQDKSVADCYDSIEYALIHLPMNRNTLNLSKCFQTLAFYEQATDHCQSLLSCMQGLFEDIISRRIVPGNLVMKSFISTLRSKELIEQSVVRALAKFERTNLHSYFYPLLIFYYSLIKYDIGKADVFLQLYKTKLMQLSYRSNTKKGRQLGVENEWDAVVVKVDIREEHIGKIKDITLNYFEHLGYSDDGSIVGKHVNELIPQQFRQSHLKRMLQFYEYSNLGKMRSLIMTDFDGSLKKADVSIKFQTSLEEPICALCQIKVQNDSRNCLLIANPELKIVEADKFFKLVLSQCGSKVEDEDCNLTSISKDLATAIKLLRLAKTLWRQESSSGETGLESGLFNSLREMNEKNRRGGIIFRVDPGSFLFQRLGLTELLVSFDVTEYFDTKGIVRVYLAKSYLRSDKLPPSPQASFLGKSASEANAKSDVQRLAFESQDNSTKHVVQNSKDKNGRTGMLMQTRSFNKSSDGLQKYANHSENVEANIFAFDEIFKHIVEAVETNVRVIGSKSENILADLDENHLSKEAAHVKEAVLLIKQTSINLFESSRPELDLNINFAAKNSPIYFNNPNIETTHNLKPVSEKLKEESMTLLLPTRTFSMEKPLDYQQSKKKTKNLLKTGSQTKKQTFGEKNAYSKAKTNLSNLHSLSASSVFRDYYKGQIRLASRKWVSLILNIVLVASADSREKQAKSTSN